MDLSCEGEMAVHSDTVRSAHSQLDKKASRYAVEKGYNGHTAAV